MIPGGYSPEAKEKPLHHYQEDVAYWVLDRVFVKQEKGAGIFLDPGLGKTRTTLSVLNYLFQLGSIRRALIIGPLRPIYTVWPTEIKRWGFPQSYTILHGNTHKGLLQDSEIELLNYDSLHKVEDLKGRWDVIVLDESTYVKNWSTKRTKSVKKLIKSIPIRLILTGTPAANSLADLHSQLFVVDDGESLGSTAYWFRSRFCQQAGFKGWKWKVRDDMASKIKKAIEDRVICLKAEDYLDMPDLVLNDIWSRLSPKEAAQYRKLKRELYAELKDGDVLAGSAAAAYGKCRQFANGQVYTGEGEDRVTLTAHKHKVAALLEVYEELAGKPLLVFYSYKHDLAAIQNGIGSDKPFAKSPVIQGGMKPEAVQKILDKWNAGGYRSILCQWQAASHGLNMQGACNDIACFGLIDSLETFEQAYRRVYRQGVTGRQVRIHRLLVEDTVDEVMRDRLAGKYDTQAAFLGALKRHAKP